MFDTFMHRYRLVLDDQSIFNRNCRNMVHVYRFGVYRNLSQ